MKHEHVTTDSIYQKMLEQVAPLPSQAKYARHLASILAMHIHRNKLIDDGISPDDLPTTSAIVVAPTGQGKTYILRKMVESLNLNLITIDCSTMAAEGWKGMSLSQRLAAAKGETKNDERFARSILFFDECDKLRLWGTEHDQANSMVNILQMFNGNKVAIECGRNVEHIDVRRFTVLFGGAFDGLEKIIRERICSKRKIGFDNSDTSEELSTAELMQYVTVADLREYGLMQELLGRIGTILTIPPLGVDDYRQLLNAETGSLRKRYRNYLGRIYGVEFEIADSGVEAITQMCVKSAYGARVINPIVNDIMRQAVATVESESTICKVVLDADEHGCCARYEYGERKHDHQSSLKKQEKETLPLVVIRAKNLPALVHKLSRYYRNAGGDFLIAQQLEAFLDCTMTFLLSCCRPSDFTFSSVEKLARVVRRSGGEGTQSPFDIIMSDAHKDVSIAQRTRFESVYTPNMQAQLISALEAIAAYIAEKNRDGRIVFSIHGKPVW